MTNPATLAWAESREALVQDDRRRRAIRAAKARLVKCLGLAGTSNDEADDIAVADAAKELRAAARVADAVVTRLEVVRLERGLTARPEFVAERDLGPDMSGWQSR